MRTLKLHFGLIVITPPPPRSECCCVQWLMEFGLACQLYVYAGLPWLCRARTSDFLRARRHPAPDDRRRQDLRHRPDPVSAAAPGDAEPAGLGDHVERPRQVSRQPQRELMWSSPTPDAIWDPGRLALEMLSGQGLLGDNRQLFNPPLTGWGKNRPLTLSYILNS